VARFTEKYWNGRWVPRDEWDAMVDAHKKANPRRGPYIITDGLADTWNPVNGQTYDSKSAYYQAVKDAGCEIVGGDSSLSKPRGPMETPGGVEKDIKQAIEVLSAGR
jgi:hypothetical protein